jgi:hypothetical protein
MKRNYDVTVPMDVCTVFTVRAKSKKKALRKVRKIVHEYMRVSLREK